ncbi:hypothetical protein SERLA73DRAFT_105004 [Serpula lacrymans var. lacrymans S7.3]|uniref:G-protein coupled receptors family 1 profile domain-containing protein n=1 Tax=Serpula lacrymans var. lacrymans (strain S7.3) TaxID=936435 RepID=F8PRZ0_SERL3|nr:hypothetical protein SERLA73DRAFT_105004 [Serpula lacrymans var. lacrymans S7.3]
MSTAVFEHAYYIGNYMSGILYGVELVMYFTIVHTLFKKPFRTRSDHFFLLYSTALLVLVSIDIATNAVWGEMMWINGQDRVGGVPAFIAEEVSVWYETLSSTSVVALIFLGDALLIYRLFILWESSYLVVIFPVLVYFGAFALAIIELVSAGVPGGDFFAGKSVNFGVPYYALTISLNIIVTALICFRLLYLSRILRHALSPSPSSISHSTGATGLSARGEAMHAVRADNLNSSGVNTSLYTSVVAIMIESAAPYTIMGIMFLVPYARGSETAIAFGQVWAKITCLSPQLIVLRVVTHRAWGRDTVAQATSSKLIFTSGVAIGAGATTTTGTGLDVDIDLEGPGLPRRSEFRRYKGPGGGDLKPEYAHHDASDDDNDEKEKKGGGGGSVCRQTLFAGWQLGLGGESERG